MARRFNPPPSWPVPPGDWKPPVGWEPDPTWPPAPPDWAFWIRESRWPRPRTILVRAGAGVVVVLVAAATVVAVAAPDEQGRANAQYGAAPTTASTAAATPVQASNAVSYRGSGDQVVAIEKPETGAVLLTVTGSGSADDFVVHSLDDRLGEFDLLVNEVGAYSGTVILDADEVQDTREVKVSYPGTWRLTLAPREEARTIAGSTVTGRGRDVFFYGGPATTALIEHTGESNFVVRALDADGPELVVNEIGTYSGERPLEGGVYVQVTADGAWSVHPR